METIPGGKCDEHGCFVYRVLKAIEARTFVDVSDKCRTGLIFKADDLVSVDFVRPSRYPISKNGPFLRLTDCHGWLFEKKYGERFLERLPVTSGLWCFYVDSRRKTGEGMALRRHPGDDSPFVEPEVVYPQYQLIYCDRKVTHPTSGVTSYRVQGTNGWVFDTRLLNDGKKIYMMLPESTVKTGLFAYEILENIAVRVRPTISKSDSVSSGLAIRTNEIVCCDVIRNQYPTLDGNGPYLRLTDGSGWIFEKTAVVTSKIVRPLPIQDGQWSFQISNGSAGIGARRQPIDRIDMVTTPLYETGDRVECNKRILSSSGVSFYRVTGTDGWVFDMRDGKSVMKLLTSRAPSPECFSLGNDQSPWSIDFIRGIAAVFDLEEICHNSTSRVISFRSDDNERINVYYTTRTIGTALDHPSQGKTQLFRRKCTVDDLKKILQNPRSHTEKGYTKRTGKRGGKEGVICKTQYGQGTCIDEEEDSIRNLILECDRNMSKLCIERESLLKSIKRHDDGRAKEANRMKLKIKQHQDEEEKKIIMFFHYLNT